MQWFHNLKISFKLVGSFLAVILLMLGVGLTGFITTQQIGSKLNSVYSNDLQPVEYLSQAREDVMASIVDVRGAIIYGSKSDANKASSDLADAKNQLQKYSKTNLTKSEHEIYSKVTPALQTYQQTLKGVVSDLHYGNGTTSSTNTSALNQAVAQNIGSTMASQGESLNGLLQQLGNINKSNAQKSNNQARVMKATSTVILVIISLAAIAVGLGLAFLISKMISDGLKKVLNLVTSVSNGDLTVKPLDNNSNDEVGRLAEGVNAMMNNLKTLISSISESSQRVAASAEQLSASSEETSKSTEHITQAIQQAAQGTQKQAESLEEGKQSILDMTTGISHIAENTNSVAVSAETANEKSVAGNEAVETVVQQMNAIQNTVRDLLDVVEQLGTKSAAIGEITDAITSIASQTNLLALNAAIEAARAGESGRGFAVVADEIRKLADESAQSAEQISSLISQIQAGTSQAVSATEDTVSQVSSGLEAVNVAGRSFEDIGTSVHSVSEQIQNVSTAAQRLSAGALQLNNSVAAIAQISEETSAGMQTVSASTEEQLATTEEIGASAYSLREMAEELQQMVSRFRLEG